MTCRPLVPDRVKHGPPKHRSTIGEAVTEAQAALEPGEHVWYPEIATADPLTLLVTGEDRRMRAFRDGKQIGWSLCTLADPSRRLPFRVFTLLGEPPYDPSAAFSSGGAAPVSAPRGPARTPVEP